MVKLNHNLYNLVDGHKILCFQSRHFGIKLIYYSMVKLNHNLYNLVDGHKILCFQSRHFGIKLIYYSMVKLNHNLYNLVDGHKILCFQSRHFGNWVVVTGYLNRKDRMMYINHADLQARLVIYIANIFFRHHYDGVIFRKIHPMERSR